MPKRKTDLPVEISYKTKGKSLIIDDNYIIIDDNHIIINDDYVNIDDD